MNNRQGKDKQGFQRTGQLQSINGLIPKAAPGIKMTGKEQVPVQDTSELELSHLWLRMNPVNMLRVDHTATKRLLEKAAKQYNEKLRAENPLDKEGKPLYNKLRVKPTYLKSASHIISLFNGHLDTLRRHKRNFKEFTLSNPKLARMIGLSTNPSTAYLHIRFLMTTPFINGKPFITSKPFHGSHHDYGMLLNEDALIAQENTAYNSSIMQCLQVANNMQELGVEIVSKTYSLRPNFSGFFSHQWLQLANLSIARSFIENNNLSNDIFVSKSKSASADLDLNKNGEQPIAPAIGKEQPERIEREPGSKPMGVPQGDTPPVAAAPPAVAVTPERTSPDQYHELLESYVKSALSVIMATLYPGYLLWENEEKMLRGYIQLFFGNYQHHRDKNSLKIFADRLGQLTRRVVLTQSFIMKYPNRYVPSPAKWFNPQNPSGFAGTKAWLEAWQTGEAQRKDYNADKKTLVELMLKYNKTPDTFTFTNAMTQLARKRDKRLKTIFSEFVINRKETYTHEKFKELQNHEN
jgi:hypothetical protein